MALSRTIRLVVLLMVLVCTAGCDQVTKQLARAQLSRMNSVAQPRSFLQFTLAENPGAFLSLGASLPQAARSAFAVAVGLGLALLLGYLIRARSLGRLCFLGLALVWAGGVSNLMDRWFRHGLVTDFMVIQVGPLHTGIFNVADFAVVIGVLLVVISMRTGPSKGGAHST